MFIIEERGRVVDKAKDWIQNKGVHALLFLLCVTAVSLPLFGKGSIYTADDLWYHLLRIENVRSGLAAGQFPVRMGTNFLNHYGYASSLCYPETLLYFPAALQLLFGMSFTRSFKIFIIVLNALTYGALYYCGKGIAKERCAGTIGAVIVMLSPYHLANIYLRGAIGELQAFLFFPFVIYGLYNLIYEDYDRPWLLGIGFWGLMMSHAISLVFALCVSFATVLFYFKEVVLNGKKLARLLITAAVVLLSTIGYWLPFLEQLASNNFKFGIPWTFVSEQALSLKRLLSLEIERYNFGLPILGMCSVWFLIRKKDVDEKQRRIFGWLLLSGLILLYCSTKYFPWKIVEPFLNSVQFPWRLYALASTFLAFSIGMMVVVKWKGPWRLACMLGVFIVMMGEGIYYLRNHPVEYVVQEQGRFEDSGNTFDIIQQEWLPEGVDLLYMRGERKVLDDAGQSVAFETALDGSLLIRIAGGECYIDCPLIWYKGYHAYQLEAEGEVQELVISNDGFNGTIRVYPKQTEKSALIRVSYDGTMIQKVSWIVSVISTVGGVCYFVLCDRKRQMS